MTKAEIVPRASEAAELDIRHTDTAVLREALYDAIGVTVSAIQRVAAIWAELERRGEDLSDIKFALAAYMRPVQAGRLLPEAVAQLAGRRRTLDAVASLPIEDQRRLIKGEAIEVVSTDRTRHKTLDEMTFPEIGRVIRDGMIRTVEEQRAGIERMETRRRLPGRRRGPKPRILVDTDTAEVTVGDKTVSIDALLAALKEAGALP